ncbi:MAG: hypothetical protein U5P41_04135 [Gammaproteobacteria bacterium]|nr:hypothetical protein [Gammaproteobacteria bacterium]
MNAGAEEAPEIVETEGQHEESFQRFFDRQLTALIRQGDRVHFEVAEDGNIAKYDPDRHQWKRSFVLAEGDRFFQRDHHGRVEFTVREIRDDGVLIEARSLFDHRSFGPEKITRDTSVVLLPYREHGRGR